MLMFSFKVFIGKYLSAALTAMALIIHTLLPAQTETLNLTRYTEEDGVPSSQIYKIINDRFGYIWLGTINGLARFDGTEFKRFYNDPNDSLSFRGLNVWAIFEDSKGRMWIASGPSYLNLYDRVKGTFRQFDFKGLIDHQENIELGISSICEDNNGRIWFGVTTNHNEPIKDGLLFIDEKSDHLQKYNGLTTGNIYNCTEDVYGNLWMISLSGLLKIDSRGEVKIVQSPLGELVKTGEYFNDLVGDNQGHIWIITNKIRLFEYDQKIGTFEIHYPSGPEEVIPTTSSYPNVAIDQEGNIWMGTDKGLQYYDRKNKKFETINSPANNILKEASILELNFDPFGSLWIGTFSGGLFRYDEKALFRTFSYNKDYRNTITSGWVNNILETTTGDIWITTTGPGTTTGMNLLNPVTGRVTNYPFETFLPGVHTVFGIMQVSGSRFLISTNIGIYQFSMADSSFSKTSLRGIPDSLVVYQFYTDSHKNLWLCTFNGLYKRSYGEDVFIRYDLTRIKTANASSNEITNLYESKKHGLWLLTNNGLFQYDYKTDRIIRHGAEKSKGDVFISQDINSLHEDKNGTVWVGTWQGGLSRYNVENGSIRTYTGNDGLPSMSVQGILGDEVSGDLWLSTFEGLSRFSTKTEQFSNFSIADGIQSQLFADGSYLKTSGGLFIFGGSNGITLFRPEDVHTNSVAPNVFLTDLKLFNQSVIPGEDGILKEPVYQSNEVILQHFQNTLTIEFQVIHYLNPSKNRSAYKLENYDTEWREVGNQRFAFYSRIPPGEYLFRVKAANNNGVWNDWGASLKIIIKPPWWKTTPAYISYAFLAFILVILVDKYFRNRLIRKEKELHLARELEHARAIEKAYTDLKNTQAQLIQSEKMASLGELTAGIAHEIKNPLNFVNNFSEVNAELIDELESEIRSGNSDSAIVLAKNIRVNEEKINFHGKRADAIVKGMLQHSRTGSGVKEPTDINSLAEEYLRLSYHGFRAKDKTFNTSIVTDYDSNLGKINVIPEEIGRVLLNLLTNAFYSVMEKKKATGDGYEPTVLLITRNTGKAVEIKVCDNGNGIPTQVMDKIFQPFYTTKPAGQGTGLGLSMSYEIITKRHNGELTAESTEGVGAEFIVRLPVTNTT